MWNLGMVGVCEDILVFPTTRDFLRFLRFVTLWLRGDPADDDDVGGGTAESHRRACSNSRE